MRVKIVVSWDWHAAVCCLSSKISAADIVGPAALKKRLDALGAAVGPFGVLARPMYSQVRPAARRSRQVSPTKAHIDERTAIQTLPTPPTRLTGTFRERILIAD